MHASPESIRSIVEMMKSEDLKRFGAAVELLTELGAAVTNELVEALSHSDKGVRLGAACVLSKVASPSSQVLQALRAAAEDPDDEVGLVANEAIHRIQTNQDMARAA